ncbi:MAG: lipoyl(octanoyl) transferase LipB [Candidatus Omnitrophica bacterium]|nr:lipoyl(octanoyl) transferase LipB [Candidatus Omnitrophota bacterium]
MIIQEKTACCVKDLGLMDYEQVYVQQKQYVDRLLNGSVQALLLCEHPAVLTLGRMTNESNIFVDEKGLMKRGIGVHHVDRGGDVTLHAPGQLVIYPILNLAYFGRDIHNYLRQLEQVAIDLLESFDIVADRIFGRTGVWIGKKKIASIGIGVRKWVSFHGLAVNVNMDLSLFSIIKPCGLDIEMTSLSEIKQETISMEEVKRRTIKCFFRNFYLEEASD